MLRVAVFATVAKGVFSGGRYHAMMIAEVLARRGHETYFVTTNSPVFKEDLAPISGSNPVRIVLTDEFDVSPGAPFDAVFVAPQMSLFPRLYKNAVRFAREANAGLVLVNYESPNWFNAFSPEPRPEEKWKEWRQLAEDGALVLSSAWESQKFAREYYTNLPPESTFDVWQPAINSVACASVPPQEREKLIVVFSRPSDAHKGGGDVAALIGPELRGYTLGLIIGNPQKAEAFLEGLRAKGAPHDITVRPYFGLSDRQKFMLLKRAAAVVFPSYFEGYGYPPLEALACDTPCIAYDLPVVRENCGDHIRYAPLGDVAALRRELLAALEAGPQPTSAAPDVIRLVDVDHRASALERVVVDYAARLGRLKTEMVDPAALDIRITPASVVPIQSRPRLFFGLKARRRIDSVCDLPAGIAKAEVLCSDWDGTGWRHDVVVTLADKAALTRLAKLHLPLRVGAACVRLPLADLVVKRSKVPELSDSQWGINKSFDVPGKTLFSGWVYPLQPYDGLLLLSPDGAAVRLHTGVKNLHYKKGFPVEPKEFCGFVSSTIDLGAFDVEHLRLFVLSKGRVIAQARTNARTLKMSHAKLPVLGTGSPKPAADRGTLVPARIEPTALDYRTWGTGALDIRLPSGWEQFTKRVQNSFARRRPDAAKAPPPAPAAADVPAWKWALSECAYSESTGELEVRGWLDQPDDLRVEIWDSDLNFLGVATNGERRPDVAKELKIAGRDDFGFSFKKYYPHDLNKSMDIRLMFGPKMIAQKLIEKIKIKKSSRSSIEDILYAPDHATLWMCGTYESPDGEPSSIEVFDGAASLGAATCTAATDAAETPIWRWHIEALAATPPAAGAIVTLLVTLRDGRTRRIGLTVPPTAKWAKAVVGLEPRPPEARAGIPDVKWAAGECAYVEDTGELQITGWLSLPDQLRVEIWTGDLQMLGEATLGQSRPDVAQKLKIKGREDFGFVFRTYFDGDLEQTMDVRLMFGTRVIARKLFDRIKPKKATQLKVEDFSYDAQWETLWMRGSYDAPGVEPANLLVCRGAVPIATAALDRKFKPDGNVFFKWRVEETVSEPPVAGETLTFLVEVDDGTVRRIAYEVPPAEKWLDGVAQPNDDLLYAESGHPLPLLMRFTDSTPPRNYDRRVLLVIHNLNAIERGEKREALLRLRHELNARKIELIILHHSKLPSGCALPEINFYSKDLEKLVKEPALLEQKLRLSGRLPEPAAEDAAVPAAPVVDDRTMNYAQRMLYGFYFALNRRPKPWSDIEKQTAEEAAKLDTAIRLVDPSLVLMWHQWNSLMIIARSIADQRGIPSAIIHEGMLPGTMTLDRIGMMAESDATGITLQDLPENAPYFARARAVIEEIRTRELDRKPQAGTAGAAQILARRREPGMKTVFYAGVNDWQSGNLPSDHPRAKIHSPVYRETMDGLEALLEVAERRNLLVLFKPHPNLFPRPLELRHDRLIYVREANATDCITGTDATVTLLSSLAYISLAHGKPTVLLGRNTLSGSHAAYELGDYSNLDSCMSIALAAHDMDQRRKRFEAHVAALLKSRLYPYGDLTGFSMLGDGDTANEIVRLMEPPRAERPHEPAAGSD
jgi:glycosyltransferase involved in cell wall biosynthesis